jgi:hypothetical protein
MDASWRREIYGGLEAWVPADWGYGNAFQPRRLRRPPGPFVGRPGGVPLVFTIYPADLAERDSYLWFDTAHFASPGIRSHDGGWVEETREVAGVHVSVLTDDDALRERLLATVRPVVDDTDCPAWHRILDGIAARPDPGRSGLAGIGPVESVTVCRYALGRLAQLMINPVMSLSTITGDDATRLIQAIHAAPQGSGPDTPGCPWPDEVHGVEAIVLIVRAGEQTQEVFVRYSGYEGHGFDDGHTRRWLTTDALLALLKGPHWPIHDLHMPVSRWSGRTPRGHEPGVHKGWFCCGRRSTNVATTVACVWSCTVIVRLCTGAADVCG